jgi:uncharacterized protein DUF29
MAVSTLYDEDICAWAEQQAATLRRLAATRRDLPNDLDLGNIAEEIEDVGNAQRSAAESFIRLMFVHLIKLAVAPHAPAARGWRKEIATFHSELLAKLTPSIPGRIDLDLLWRRALREARLGLEADELDTADPQLWTKLKERPLDLALLTQEEFDLRSALDQVLPRV